MRSFLLKLAGDRGGEMGDRVVTMLVDVGFHASTQPTRSAIALQENQGDRGVRISDRAVVIPVDVGFHASTQTEEWAIALQENQGDRGVRMPVGVGFCVSTQPKIGDRTTRERERSRYE
jgi:hypothetical protein